MIEYSTNARGYTLVTLCFLLLLILGLGLIDQPTLRGWLLFAAIGAVGFYTIPIMLYAFGIAAVWLALSLVVRHRSLTPLKGLIAATALCAGLTLVLYLPVFIVSGVQSVTGSEFVTALSWNDLAQKLPESIAATWDMWNRHLPGFVTISLVLGVILSILLHRRSAVFPVPMLIAILLCSPVLLIQRLAPYPRIWLFLLLVYAVLGAAGWVALVHRLSLRRLKAMPVSILAVVLCIALTLTLPLDNQVNPFDEIGVEDNAREITLSIKSLLQTERSSIQVLPPSETLIFYFEKYGVPLNLFPKQLDEVNADLLLIDVTMPEYTLDRLMRLLEDYHVDFSPYGTPQLLQTLPFAQIYVVTRR